MGMRPAISAPLPWLAMAAGRLLAGSGRGRPLLRLPRSLKVTREGKWFIGGILLIGIAAINTGNNLLYLVLATLLSLIIVSGVMSEATLRGLAVARGLPRYAFRGSPVRVGLRAVNNKRLLASFSFHVAEADGSGRSAYFVKLGAGQAQTQGVDYTFRRRGLARLGKIRVTTRFPFGLFVKGKVELVEGETLVLPSVEPSKALRCSPALSAGGPASTGRGEGAELYGLRGYTLGDDARRIHWRSAARGEGLLAKEFERESDRRAVIIFDNCAGGGEEDFEELVDTAAATAAMYSGMGWSIGLRTLSSRLEPASGREQLIKVLSSLALAEPVEAAGTPGVRVEA